MGSSQPNDPMKTSRSSHLTADERGTYGDKINECKATEPRREGMGWKHTRMDLSSIEQRLLLSSGPRTWPAYSRRSVIVFWNNPSSKACVSKVVTVKLVSKKTIFCTWSWEGATPEIGQRAEWKRNSRKYEQDREEEEESRVWPRSSPKILFPVLGETCFPCH